MNIERQLFIHSSTSSIGFGVFFSVTHGMSENSDVLKALVHGRTSLFTKHIAVPQLHCAEILQMISEVLIKLWVHTRNVHCNDYSCAATAPQIAS